MSGQDLRLASYLSMCNLGDSLLSLNMLICKNGADITRVWVEPSYANAYTLEILSEWEFLWLAALPQVILKTKKNGWSATHLLPSHVLNKKLENFTKDGNSGLELKKSRGNIGHESWLQRDKPTWNNWKEINVTRKVKPCILRCGL